MADDKFYIAMIGDSLTADFWQMNSQIEPSLSDLCNRVKVGAEQLHVLNMGKSGMTSGDWLRNDYWWFEMERHFTSFEPETIKIGFIMLGTNDAAVGVEADEYMKNLAVIIGRVSDLGVKPVLQTLPPAPASDEMNSLVLEYNKALQNLANEKKLDILAIYERFLDELGEPRPALYEADMVHLRNEAGLAYSLWLEALADYISRSLLML